MISSCNVVARSRPLMIQHDTTPLLENAVGVELSRLQPQLPKLAQAPGSGDVAAHCADGCARSIQGDASRASVQAWWLRMFCSSLWPAWSALPVNMLMSSFQTTSFACTASGRPASEPSSH